MGRSKLIRLIQTLIHVKTIQLFYQIKYRILKPLGTKKVNHYKVYPIHFENEITIPTLWTNQTRFSFLNLDFAFDHINWNYSEFGKLWTYNLNYFEFLLQEDITKEEGLKLIRDFCSNSKTIQDGYEPYPISLRGINWIKFLSKHNIDDQQVNNQLYADYQRLLSRIEYHILANHLFENGFSLLFGAYYFQSEKLYSRAKKIIRSELREQILSDGAHYELSPMYHQIILYRILDCYQLVTNNHWKQSELGAELKNTAEKMLGWLKAVEFKNGDIPMVNDSTNNIAPSPKELFHYAETLTIYSKPVILGESGYRMLKTNQVEIFFDVGQISPSYQPGHSHADSLQFLLYFNDQPIVVDTGISTYEKNARRQLERSTQSHNTVTVNHLNSSDVWSGFRVGRRAKTTIHTDNPALVKASHNGYRKYGIVHDRTIEISETECTVTDELNGNSNSDILEGHLHFFPGTTVTISGNQVLLNDDLIFLFDQKVDLSVETYEYCHGYNKHSNAPKLIYQFKGSTSFKIKTHQIL